MGRSSTSACRFRRLYIGCTQRNAAQPLPRGDPQRLGDLPGREVAHRRVADLALRDQVVQGAERVLDGRVLVEVVQEIEVQVVGAQPLQAPLHLVHDGGPGVPPRQRALPHREVDLGGQDDLVALAGDQLAQDPLRVAARRRRWRSRRSRCRPRGSVGTRPRSSPRPTRWPNVMVPKHSSEHRRCRCSRGVPASCRAPCRDGCRVGSLLRAGGETTPRVRTVPPQLTIRLPDPPPARPAPPGGC